MKILIEKDGKTFNVEQNNALSIAIPLDFYGAQPNAYGVEAATSEACQTGDLTGDTRRGGSCNFEQIKLIPHCNGTHTESIGHITNERISVYNCLKDGFSLACLVTVEAKTHSETEESYPFDLAGGDKLITRKAVKEAMVGIASGITNYESIIIRTVPNSTEKLSKTYLEKIPAFFSSEAIEFINEIGIKHLLCDLPSIDRIFDEGKLSNHRKFWNVEQGSFEVSPDSFLEKTITELIYAPDEIKDGAYLLNLQIAPFLSDAAPSRPVLFKIIFS